MEEEAKMFCGDPDCKGWPGCPCRNNEFWREWEARKNKQAAIDDLLRACYSAILCWERDELDKREIALLRKYADAVKASTNSQAA